VSVKEKMNSMGTVPELPVVDVDAHNSITEMHSAFEIGWLYRQRDWSRVARSCGEYSFGRGSRHSKLPFHWVFAEDIDASYQTESLGANIVILWKKSLGEYVQFTVKDSRREPFYFHHD